MIPLKMAAMGVSSLTPYDRKALNESSYWPTMASPYEAPTTKDGQYWTLGPYPSTCYPLSDGWLVYLCDDDGLLEESDISDNLRNLVRDLRKQGFDWVRFDEELD